MNKKPRIPLNNTERKETIQRILDDISVNLYAYRDFILDCVEYVIKDWDDEDLLRWTGVDIE